MWLGWSASNGVDLSFHPESSEYVEYTAQVVEAESLRALKEGYYMKKRLYG